MKTKVIFMGTPEFAVPVLDVLCRNADVVLVVTQPDKAVGRKREIKFSPIKEKALKENIEVFQPVKIKDEMDKILNLDVDLIVTCAYGQILPDEILNHSKIASINVHASLLPKLRGGAPIHHAIIDGYNKTGVTVMYMDSGMDSGDIISTSETPIFDTDNVGTLHDRLSTMGAELLEKTLPSIINKTNNRIKQNEDEVTFAYTIKREEEHIDFNNYGKDIINKIRGLNPFPTANIILNDEEVKILEASFMKCKVDEVYKVVFDNRRIGVTCKDGVIYFDKLKPSGKSVMFTNDYMNGVHNKNWSVR